MGKNYYCAIKDFLMCESASATRSVFEQTLLQRGHPEIEPYMKLNCTTANSLNFLSSSHQCYAPPQPYTALPL
jgi:hypothetical protein